MQLRLLRLLGIIFVFAIFTGVLGCGDEELLDEPGNMYTAHLVFYDGPNEDETISIDVYRQPDCNLDGTADDPEDYGPVYAALTIEIDSSANGLTLTEYQIEYIPLNTPLEDGTTTDENTPMIALEDNMDRGGGTDYFPSDAITTLTFTFMTSQTKAEFLNWWVTNYPDPFAIGGSTSILDQGRYTFRLTCYFEDDFGVERTMVFERTVYLGAFDRC